MKLEGVTAFKIRPCPASMEIMDPALDAKTVGELCGQWRGNLLKASSLHAEDGKLFTGLDNGLHQRESSEPRAGSDTCNMSPEENLSASTCTYLSQIPTSAFTLESEKNWDERHLLCVA